MSCVLFNEISTQDGHKIVEMTLNAERSLNALTFDMMELIFPQLLEIQDDDSVVAVILDGAGEKAFCAGASFDELLEINDLESGKQFFGGFAAVINAMRKSPKFIVARVHGKAVGGGVGLVAAADYALATDECSVKLSEFALGIGPFVVGPAVERKIGKAAFAQMSTDFEWYDATWARNKGLYADTFENITELDEAIEEITAKLAKASPEAAKELKTIFWEGTENWDTLLAERAEISGRLVMSEFTREYIRQFKAK